MGKLSRRFNQKARQVTIPTNRTEENNALKKLVDEPSELGKFDESNPLVTKSTKEKLKVKKSQEVKIKILSNKQKKKLQKVLELKKKKEKRSQLLESLANHQVTQEELSCYKSSTQLGNTKVSSKRKYVEKSTDYNVGKRRRNRKKKAKTQTHTKEVKTLENEISSSTDNDSDTENENDETVDKETSEIKEEAAEISEDDKDRQQDQQQQQQYEKKNDNKQKENQKGKVEHDLENKGSMDPPQISKESKKQCEIPLKKEPVTASDVVQPSKLKKVQPIFQQIDRKPEIQTARMMLPIIAEEQVIMETINDNDVTIICGSTGSGKTTQIPQFLFEAGYGTHDSRSGMIGITEPRRVAAVSMSKRVAEEMNMSTRKVSYQIRYEGNTTDETILKFMTDGVLLKEIEADFLLTKYSCIIIDEAHERSVYTDILIGLLSRIVPLRKKKNSALKLIIMSATLRVEDFRDNKRLFPDPPPAISVDGRQYPVTIHFNKRTLDDYVTEAYKKVCKIHRTLKLDGGILVFLTGQNEVLALCRKLSRSFPKHSTTKMSKATTKSNPAKATTTKSEKIEDQNENETRNENCGKQTLPKINLDSYTLEVNSDVDDRNKDEIDELPLSDNEMQDGSSSSDDEDDDILNEIVELRLNRWTGRLITNQGEFTSAVDQSSPLHVLPLYSLLSTRKQQEVFRHPPEGSRLCVVATNVAETSLTIPGIKYIVDSGRVKRKLFDKLTGVSTFKITWTSKASANQRAGRAGRVGPGHCYRLYSSAVFQNDFEEFGEPEILRKPVEDLVLQMKNLCIEKVSKFPFPTVPERESIQAAETLLLRLGALRKQVSKQGTESTTITSVGKKLCRLPISPRFSKMILLCVPHKDCLQYIIAIVAALTVKEIFTDDIDITKHAEDENEIKNKRILITRARRKWTGEGAASLLGDLMVILRAVGACEYTGCSEDFCKSNGLRYKAMLEIRKLRTQLTNAVSGICSSEDAIVDPKMKPPDDQQATVIRKIVLSCFGDHVARKIPPQETKEKNLKNAYMSCLTENPVYIHPTSSLFTKLPDYLVFHEMIETKKIYMKACVTMEEDWLPVYAPYMCTLSKPLEDPPPCLEDGKVKCFRSSSYGPHVWPITPRYLECHDWPQRYRWFARFLLEGKVFDSLNEFSDSLLTPASVMVKSWSHLQPKTESMLAALHKHEIETKEKLMKQWNKDPHFLLKEYLQWLPESCHVDVQHIWPPCSK